MLLTYLVDRLHLVDDGLAPPEQARLHKSPSTITDLPIQDSMLGLLSPPVRLLLLSGDINAEVETYLGRLRAGEMDLADVLGYAGAAVNEGNFSRVRPQQPAIYLVRDN